MRVLIACEYSGTVRDAFIALGHDAMSCDMLPTDVPGPHHTGDVRELLKERWDILIAFPPLHVSMLVWYALDGARIARPEADRGRAGFCSFATRR